MFSETGVEATRRPIHWVTGGVCLLPTRGGHEVSSSFPLIKISRCTAFLVENASNGAASSPQMPRGCRIFAHFLRPHCVEGKFCQWLQRFLIPTQRPVSRWCSASQGHHSVTRCKGKETRRRLSGQPTRNLKTKMKIMINYCQPVKLESLHFGLASPRNIG